MSSGFVVRNATKEDADSIIALIQELADFEKAGQEVSITAGDIAKDGFGEKPAFKALLAEENNVVVGLALLYDRYSTWKGKTLYLEDLIITESARGKGVGKFLLQSCEEQARNGGYKRLEWQVLDWNKPAIEFYRSLGVEMDETWINCRMVF